MKTENFEILMAFHLNPPDAETIEFERSPLRDITTWSSLKLYNFRGSDLALTYPRKYRFVVVNWPLVWPKCWDLSFKIHKLKENIENCSKTLVNENYSLLRENSDLLLYIMYHLICWSWTNALFCF